MFLILSLFIHKCMILVLNIDDFGIKLPTVRRHSEIFRLCERCRFQNQQKNYR